MIISHLLKKKIAEHWNVGTENILLGAGSSDIIGLACQHTSKTKGHILTSEPSYKVWNGQASSFGHSFKRIPLTDERKTDLPKVVAAINNETRMIYFCNPNNPTGTVVEVSQLKDHVSEASQKTFVFIDEAYTEYAELTFTRIIGDHKSECSGGKNLFKSVWPCRCTGGLCDCAP